VIKQRVLAAGLALLGMALASSVTDAAETETGFYAGGGIGEANLEIDDSGFDDADTAFKVFGGYRFNQYFGVELAYFDGGTAEGVVDDLNGVLEVDTSGVNLSAMVTAPLAENFSLFAKLGYASIELDATLRSLGQRFGADSVTEEELSYGAGASYSFNENFAVRLEYEAFDIDDADADLLTLNAVFKF
jgi:OmpA-OmpF porin, OOP family